MDLFRKFSPDHPELVEAELFRWQHCRRFIALMGNKVVGHIAQIPAVFYLSKLRNEIAWAATFVVDTSNPLVQTFAGTSLLNEVTTQSTLPFAAVGVVPQIEETHRRRGYVLNRKAVAMYSRFFHPEKALRYMDKPSFLGTVIAGINRLFREQKQTIDHAKAIRRFDPAWDPIWLRNLSLHYHNFGERTAEYLNYKIAQPNKQYKNYIHLDRLGNPDGYIIFRYAQHRTKDLRLVKVCDLVGTAVARKEMIQLAFEYAGQQEAYGIVALGSVTDAKLFRIGGMWLKQSYTVVFPNQLAGATQISFFDSDLDNLW